MKPTPQERAAAIGVKARSQPPVDERRLGTMLDRSIRRTWYRVTRHPAISIDVAFNPEVTITEARARYPDCTVEA